MKLSSLFVASAVVVSIIFSAFAYESTDQTKQVAALGWAAKIDGKTVYAKIVSYGYPDKLTTSKPLSTEGGDIQIENKLGITVTFQHLTFVLKTHPDGQRPIVTKIVVSLDESANAANGIH